MDLPVQDLFLNTSTAMLCISVYVVMFVGRYVGKKLWSTEKVWLRYVVKYVGTMWLPIWPVALGAALSLLGWQIPAALAEAKMLQVGFYGAFCGMVSAGVVTAVVQILKKKGVSPKLPDVEVEVDVEDEG